MSLSIRRRLSAFVQHRKVRRGAAILGGLVFLYGVIGFFILPGIVKSKV